MPLLDAAPSVQVERGRIEGPSWHFPSIVSPRRGDLAESATLSLVGGTPDAKGAPLAELANGNQPLGTFRFLLWDLRATESPKASSPLKTHTFYTEFDVHGPNTMEDAQPAQLAAGAAEVERFILVYKTHFDIGYTQLARDVVQSYRTTMIDQALKVVDDNANLPRDQQFVWTIPGWPMKEILADWPGQSTERKQRITRAFQSGRFAVHALPFTVHTDVMDSEELTRGFIHSSQLARSIGKPLPRAAKMTDVPCHSWILPTLLKHAGVDFLHLGCNGHSSPVEVPTLFWWEGPDGSRVLTYYSADGYGTGLLPSPHWPHKTWLALIHTGDNHGPPRPDEVSAHIKRIREKFPKARITVGELSDFADALLAEKPTLPVVRADMPDTWIHGPMSSPVGMKLARNARPQLAAAEALGSLLGTTGQEAAIARAYETCMLHSEHTWGLSHAYHKHHLPDGEQWDKLVKDGLPDLYRRFEASWDEHRSYIEESAAISSQLLTKNLDLLARSVAVNGKRTVVFNPLPWPRSGIVLINGKPRFVESVPPGGWTTLAPHDSPDPSGKTDTNILDNPHFRLTLAPDRAAVNSVIDKRDGRELVDKDARFGLGEYLYQQFSRAETDRFRDTYTRNRNAGFGKTWLPDTVPHIEATPKSAKWTITRGTDADVAETSCPAGNGVPHATRLRITIYQKFPVIDMEVFIDNKPPTARPEAGWICLPFAIDKPAFRLGRLGGIADPATDFVRASNRHLISLESGLTVTGPDGRGVGICSADSPVVSLGKPGAWEFSRDFTPQRSQVFIHLYNNMWSTNFPMWIKGSWSAKVRLWPTCSADQADSLVTPSLETRHPLLAATVDAPAGKLPATASGVAVSRKGVLVTAFGKNPDGQGTLLRVWDQSGGSGDITVTLPGNPTVATPVNLRGEKSGGSLPIKNGKLTLGLPSYAPASFVLE
ncbi:MAG: hypothetical protein J0M04_19605 [Verrucomicrobia bacterium]|nr:hypothetical protein [Verrucomicrobiota bacterium]